MVKLTFFILSVLVAVIWIGVPFILAFIFIMSVIDDSGDKKQKEEKKMISNCGHDERGKIFRRKSRKIRREQSGRL